MPNDASQPPELTDNGTLGTEALRLSEARFRAVAESASDAIATIDTKSKILFVNRAAEKIFGYSIEEMLGQEITMLMPDYLRHVHKSAVARYTETGHKHMDWARVQLPGLHKDGREIPVELSIAEHLEAGEKRFTGILRDVSERVESEQKLTRQTARIGLLQNVAVASNQANSVEDAITAALPQLCEHTGAVLGHAYFLREGSPVTLIPSSLWYTAQPDKFAAFRHATEVLELQLGEGLPGRAARLRAPVWIRDIDQESQFVRKSECLAVHLKTAFAFPIMVKGDVNAVLEFFCDQHREPDDLLDLMASIGAQLGRVMERQRSESSLRQLSARLLRSQDEERRRIGRELHDSAGQFLAALQMNLSALMDSVSPQDASTRLKLSESLDLAQQCSTEIRTLSYLLHPPQLEYSGLVPAVRWFVEGFAKRSGIDIAIDIQSDLGRLKDDIELALFRIIQECLTNIHRHSESKTASIRIITSDNLLTLQISDQGKGIPLQQFRKVARTSGVGIAGMRERLAQLDGVLQISSDSTGTVVTASIPLVP
ncbi:MAG: PAS domain S-box protein [Acidipila sp.]|nr:PAS domain S-box protein [Acidipila sp.]